MIDAEQRPSSSARLESAKRLNSDRYEGGTRGETIASFKLPDGNRGLYIIQDEHCPHFDSEAGVRRPHQRDHPGSSLAA
jgi:hypothetical protein